MSEDPRLSQSDLTQVQRGLRMAHPPDPSKLAREREALAAMEGQGWWARTRFYSRLIGPGYLQSAMTLGSGTAATAVLAGALYGYQLLWVAPVAMILGVVMLSAVSHQTLSTEQRPFAAMSRHAGPVFAWGWALAALIASIIWHFPQYGLGAAALADIGSAAGMAELPPQGLSFVILALAVALSMLYGSSPNLLRWYERILKIMVWGIVLCFALVVIKTGVRDGGELLRGFFTFQVPPGKGVALVVGGLAAAVGINMLFLYPYSLLARGWGREHRRLARFDLFSGMFLPYTLAASLIIIATANTIQIGEGETLSVIQAAGTLGQHIGPTTGRVVFGLGILGMALSSITLHMLCTGFVCAELFGFEVGGWKHRLATLLPTPGVLGPVFWANKPFWLPVVTTIICGLMLPLAYTGFLILQRRKAYLGDDRPEGIRGSLWFTAMVLTTLLVTYALGYYVVTRLF